MIRLITFLAFIFFISINNVFAQIERCGFDRKMELKRTSHEYQTKRAIYERYVKQFTERTQGRSSGGTITIPCVVHILHTGQAVGTEEKTSGGVPLGANPSDAQVESAITDMNDAFGHKGIYDTPAKNGFWDAAMDVEFVLAKRKSDGSSTTGIIRHNLSSESYATQFRNHGLLDDANTGVALDDITNSRYFPAADYMNIWVTHRFDEITTLGVASFPASNPGAEDGLIMQYSAFGYDPDNSDGYLLEPLFNGNGTTNHEIGHYLSLEHTFLGDNGGTNCPANVNCGTNSDCCADTPPHIRTDGCPAYDATGNSCTGGPNSTIHNFMDYIEDACVHGFSEDQKARMMTALNGPRASICQSLGEDVPDGTYPSDATPSAITGIEDNYFGIYDVTLNGTTFKSLSSYHDGGYVNRIASQPTVDLEHGTNYTINIQVGVDNTSDNEIVGVFADYNGDGDFTDVGEELGTIAPTNGTNNGGTHAISFTTPAQGAAPTGQRIRLRIISDFDDDVTPISGSTIPIEGGQIEDYSIRLSTVVPVELASFDAILLENETVQLSWTTASEINNSHFEIERSEDGEHFSRIGYVAGYGNSVITQEYSFVDGSPKTGLNYYRLKQMDFDGKFEYSKIETIKIDNAISVISIYPNPTRDILYVEGIKDSYKLTIYNQLGKVIATYGIEAIENELDISQLSQGVYYFQFSSQGTNQVERVIVK